MSLIHPQTKIKYLIAIRQLDPRELKASRLATPKQTLETALVVSIKKLARYTLNVLSRVNTIHISRHFPDQNPPWRPLTMEPDSQLPCPREPATWCHVRPRTDRRLAHCAWWASGSHASQHVCVAVLPTLFPSGTSHYLALQGWPVGCGFSCLSLPVNRSSPRAESSLLVLSGCGPAA